MMKIFETLFVLSMLWFFAEFFYNIGNDVTLGGVVAFTLCLIFFAIANMKSILRD
jgi:hypothetical protein